MISNTPIETLADIAISTSAVQVVTRLVIAVFQKITGNAYSSSDVKRMNELKRLYKHIAPQSPIFWELDASLRPTHCVDQTSWHRYVDEMKQEKSANRNFTSQSNLIAEYAASYLSARSHQFFSRRKTGDIIEQFMGEWINFALNTLPVIRYDDIDKIQKRMDYIDAIVNHESLFKRSTWYKKNLFEALQKIKSQLMACIDIAAIEALRECARETLQSCRSSTTSLLISCANALYLTRSSPAYKEPLDLYSYVFNEEHELFGEAKELYPRIKKSHTGALLSETVQLAGLAAFGIVAQSYAMESVNTYFNAKHEIIPFELTEKPADLPPWVDKKSELDAVKQMQQLAQSILRIAKLKHLIDSAHHLTGLVGNLWAYGDKQGKKSLETLLFLLENELTRLKNTYGQFYTFHTQQREQSRNKDKLKSHDAANINFNRVNQLHNHVNEDLKALTFAIQKIREQMSNFPANAPELIDRKKQFFYQSLLNYLHQFHPEQTDFIHALTAARTQPLDAVAELDHSALQDDHYRSPTKITQKPLPQLIFPIQHSQNNPDYWYLDKPDFSPFLAKKTANLQKPWRLGQRYQQWIHGFITRHLADLKIYQADAAQLQRCLRPGQDSATVHTQADKLITYLHQCKKQIQLERPAWRFKIGLWPIKTKGWPFNGKARDFANYMLSELNTMESNIRYFARAVENQLETLQALVKEEKVQQSLSPAVRKANTLKPAQLVSAPPPATATHTALITTPTHHTMRLFQPAQAHLRSWENELIANILPPEKQAEMRSRIISSRRHCQIAPAQDTTQMIYPLKRFYFQHSNQ